MTHPELDIEIIRQFREDVGAAADEITDIFLEDTRDRLLKMDQLMADCDWQGLANQAHTLKSSNKTFGLVQLADIAGQLEHTCRNNDEKQTIRLMGEIQNSADGALDAFADAIKEMS
jgi:HPt (histidine-containing phosphotransfer) domain-containing protein